MTLVVLIFLITGCQNGEPLELILYQHDYLIGDNMSNFKRTQTGFVIHTYDEYLEVISNEDRTRYDEIFFSTKSLIVEPMISEKEPTFSMTSYSLDGETIYITLQQKNDIVRDTFVTLPNQQYSLVFEVNTKAFKDYEIAISEEQPFESYFFQIENYVPFDWEDNYTFIEDYQTYVSIFENIDIYMYDTSELLHIIDESTFDSNFVFIFQRLDISPGNYVNVMDVFFSNRDYSPYKNLYISYGVEGLSPAINPVISIAIIIMDKAEYENSDSNVYFLKRVQENLE